MYCVRPQLPAALGLINSSSQATCHGDHDWRGLKIALRRACSNYNFSITVRSLTLVPVGPVFNKSPNASKKGYASFLDR